MGVLPFGGGDTEVEIRSVRSWHRKSSVKGVSGRGNSDCKDMRKEMERGSHRWLGPGGEATQQP